MFGRKRFLLALPPPSTPPFPSPDIPFPGPGPIFSVSIGASMLEPICDANGVWLCGPYAADPIQGAQGKSNAWAIWLNPTGSEHRVRRLGVNTNFATGGRLFDKGQLELFFGTCPPPRPGDNPFTIPLDALHRVILHPTDGILHQSIIIPPVNNDIYEAQLFFRDAGNLYATTRSHREGTSIRSIADHSWVTAITPPVLSPPPTWGDGFFSQPKLACQPVLSPDGSWIMSYFTRFRSVDGTKTCRAAAICSTSGMTTRWSTVLGDPFADVGTVSSDVADTGEIYVAIELNSPIRPTRIETHKLGADGSMRPGWPQHLKSRERLSEVKVRVSTRDVFVSGIMELSVENRGPFVASYKYDGTPSTLFGHEFRASSSEQWYRCSLTVLNEDFFLTGYTVTPDSNDPNKQEHAIHISKFDRYGVLI